MTPLAMGFEALMFVHAALNDSVFGIDQNLRKTFRTTMFTGTGALLFITATEFMEQVLGQGLIGGVAVGVLFLGLRGPVLSVIDGMSSRLIPANYTTEETAYLEAYKVAMDDFIITADERKMLKIQAKTLGISDQRVQELEQDYNSGIEATEEE
jgi:hypothetical protein